MNYFATIAAMGALVLGSHWFTYSQLQSSQANLNTLTSAQTSIIHELEKIGGMLEQSGYQPSDKQSPTQASLTATAAEFELIVVETIRDELSKLSNLPSSATSETYSQQPPSSAAIAAFDDAVSMTNSAIDAGTWTEAVAKEISAKSQLLTADQKQDLIGIWGRAIEDEFLPAEAALFPPI